MEQGYTTVQWQAYYTIIKTEQPYTVCYFTTHIHTQRTRLAHPIQVIFTCFVPLILQFCGSLAF